MNAKTPMILKQIALVLAIGSACSAHAQLLGGRGGVGGMLGGAGNIGGQLGGMGSMAGRGALEPRSLQRPTDTEALRRPAQNVLPAAPGSRAGSSAGNV